jgi:hypothetical protein
MPDDREPPDADAPLPSDPDTAAGADAPRDRGISDFVKRAVSAGFEAAARSKEDVVRVATTEIRNWLDRLELDTELRKALSNMVLEVKAEIRFRPAEDGKTRPQVETTELKARRTERDKDKDRGEDG